MKIVEEARSNGRSLLLESDVVLPENPGFEIKRNTGSRGRARRYRGRARKGRHGPRRKFRIPSTDSAVATLGVLAAASEKDRAERAYS